MKLAAPLLVLAGLASSALAQNPALAKAVGRPLPRLRMVSTKGETITNASLKGKVVVLDFWATWCAPCRRASPFMQKLDGAYGAKGLRVVGADSGEFKAGTAVAYAKQHGYTYAFTEKNDAFAHALGVSALPAFVLVDRKGVVRKVWTGLPDGDPEKLYAEIESAARPLLKG